MFHVVTNEVVVASYEYYADAMDMADELNSVSRSELLYEVRSDEELSDSGRGGVVLGDVVSQCMVTKERSD